MANGRKKFDLDRTNFEQDKSSEFLNLDVYTNPINRFCPRLAERKLKIQYKNGFDKGGKEEVANGGVK